MFFRRTNALVGLDIGSSAVKAIELGQSANSYRVSAIGSEPVPPNSIVDGAIVNAGAVVKVIREVFRRTRIKTREVAVSLPGNAVMVKKITLPAMSDDELAGSIPWAAEEHIPFALQDVALDYQVLRGGAGNRNRGSIDVVLVAAKKETVADVSGAISQAGLVPVVVDVDAFALQNAFEVNYGADTAGVTALINAGASAVNINIIEDRQSLFTRDTSMGGNAYTEALSRDLGLTFEDADLVKRGIPAGGAVFGDAAPIIRTVTENLLLEIEKTFDFFDATAVSARIDLLVVSGGATGVDGFRPALANRFDIPVSPLDPFRRIAYDRKQCSEGTRQEFESTAAVAAGLALRQVDDR